MSSDESITAKMVEGDAQLNRVLAEQGLAPVMPSPLDLIAEEVGDGREGMFAPGPIVARYLLPERHLNLYGAIRALSREHTRDESVKACIDEVNYHIEHADPWALAWIRSFVHLRLAAYSMVVAIDREVESNLALYQQATAYESVARVLKMGKALRRLADCSEYLFDAVTPEMLEHSHFRALRWDAFQYPWAFPDPEALQ